jgi:DnaJ-class molecular chaperone
MGMDVYGKNPTSEVGEYFGNNVWYWRPLWELCKSVPGGMKASAVMYGQSNDGDGLEEASSVVLANTLLKALEEGWVDEYIETRNRKLESLPEVSCRICAGTGLRKTPPETGAGTLKCNGCSGKGSAPSIETWYQLDRENVEKFANFLSHCGGFEIW